MTRPLLLKNSLIKVISLIFICIFFNTNKSLFAQKTDISFKNIRLDSVLLYFTNHYDYKFAFDNELAQKRYVTQHFNKISPEKGLKEILTRNGFTCKYINSVYVIYPDRKIENKKKNDKSVIGIVKDKETGESLPFAHIRSKDKKRFCVSNQDGYFTMLQLPDDSISLEISYVGYSPTVVNVKPGLDKKPHVFLVSSFNQTLEEIVINAESVKTIQSNDKASLTTLNTLNIQSLPNSGESDVLKLVQLIPGVKCSNESSADLIIRGGSMDQNLILFDDFSLYHVDHFYGMVSSLNSNVIKHIQVYKGGFDARYGGRMNSVINITGKSGNNIKPSVNIGLNMLSANLMVEAPLFKKGSILLAGRRSYTDLFQTSLYKELFKNINQDELADYGFVDSLSLYKENYEEPVFYFYDVNAKLSYSITEKDKISFSYFSSLDELQRGEIIYESIFETSDDILGNTGLSVRWSRQWNDKLYSKIIYSYSNYFNEFITVEDYYAYDNDVFIYETQNTNQLKEKAFKIGSEYKLNDKFSFEFGYEYTNQNILNKLNFIDFAYGEDYGYSEESKNMGKLNSIYFQSKFNSKNKLNVITGLRTSYYGLTNKIYFEPRLNLQYKLSEHFTFKGATGNYNQFLTKVYTGEQLSNTKRLWFISDDKNIPVGNAKHYILGLTCENNDFVVDFELYKKNVDGIVKYMTEGYYFSFDSSSDSSNIFEEDTLFDQGTSSIIGGEVLISKKFNNFFGWISYSLSVNKNRFNNLYDTKNFPSVNDQRHEFKIAGVKTIKNWEIGFTWLYGTGFNRTEPYLINYSDYIDKLPDYHRLDLSLNYKLKFKHLNGRVGVSVINLYNRQNKRIKESFIFKDDYGSTYNLQSLDLTGRAISAYLNIKL